MVFFRIACRCRLSLLIANQNLHLPVCTPHTTLSNPYAPATTTTTTSDFSVLSGCLRCHHHILPPPPLPSPVTAPSPNRAMVHCCTKKTRRRPSLQFATDPPPSLDWPRIRRSASLSSPLRPSLSLLFATDQSGVRLAADPPTRLTAAATTTSTIPVLRDCLCRSDFDLRRASPPSMVHSCSPLHPKYQPNRELLPLPPLYCSVSPETAPPATAAAAAPTRSAKSTTCRCLPALARAFPGPIPLLGTRSHRPSRACRSHPPCHPRSAAACQRLTAASPIRASAAAPALLLLRLIPATSALVTIQPASSLFNLSNLWLCESQQSV
ncbi:hypothetical protein Syun_001341 [Stephania yunnanensis]|uniref:Uncharacterized protein n=1 Tax=Stephania yunnanensis TaxID=152371 RepID=A0AAP0LDX0_9MAGN